MALARARRAAAFGSRSGDRCADARGTAADLGRGDALGLGPARGRLEARRRADAGASRRRPRRRLHPHARRRHARPPEVVAAVRALPVRGRARRRGDRAARRRRGPPVPGDGRALRRRGGTRAPPRSLFFDVLHVDGRTCSTRRSRSGRGARRSPRRSAGLPRIVTGDEEAAATAFDAALAAGHEGSWSRRRAPRTQPGGRLGLAQGQAASHARPCGARGRVGPRASAGPAVEPPFRRGADCRGVRRCSARRSRA